jgi:2'-5' RNA ligase
MQKHVVVARFDNETNAIFDEWKAMAYETQNITYDSAAAWPPHITIAAYEDVDIKALCEWVSEYTALNSKIEICFNSLGVFAHGKQLDTDVIFLSPTNSLEFSNFYYNFHDKLDEFSGNYGWFYTAKCNHPIFHSTITVCNKQDFNLVFDKLRDNFRMIKGNISALEIYENPKKLVSRYELK